MPAYLQIFERCEFCDSHGCVVCAAKRLKKVVAFDAEDDARAFIQGIATESGEKFEEPDPAILTLLTEAILYGRGLATGDAQKVREAGEQPNRFQLIELVERGGDTRSPIDLGGL